MHRLFALLLIVPVGGVLWIAACSREVAQPRIAALAQDVDGESVSENVIRRLEESYRNRDLAQFRDLLAPEFKFVFQAADVRAGSPESWGREEELTSTGNMFSSPKVSGIEIELRVDPALPALDPGLTHTHRVRVNHTRLVVRLRGKPPLVVNGSRQDLFVRRLRDDHGSERWVIVEWRDLPAL